MIFSTPIKFRLQWIPNLSVIFLLAITLGATEGFATINSKNKTKTRQVSTSEEDKGTSTSTMNSPSNQPPALTGLIQIARSTSLIDYQDGSRKDSLDYQTRLSLKLNTNYSLRLDSGYSQDLKNSENNDFGDSSLTLARAPTPLGKLFLLGGSMSAVAPTSKDSRIRQGLQTAFSTGFNLAINPKRLLPGVSIAGSASVRKNVHQYETALDGSVNTEYSSGQSISVAYQNTAGISISGEFIHKNGLTYQGNIKEAFEHTEELGYSINDNLSAAVGHTNAGSILKANGQDSNLALINNNTSIVYVSMGLTF